MEIKTLETLRIRVIFSFVQNLSKGIWIFFAFSHHVTSDSRVSIFSMPWWIIILLSFDQLPTFYLLHFQCCEISLWYPLIWRVFLSVLLPLGHHPFLSKPLSSFMLMHFPSWSSCGCMCKDFNSYSVNIPTGSYFICNSIYVKFKICKIMPISEITKSTFIGSKRFLISLLVVILFFQCST